MEIEGKIIAVLQKQEGVSARTGNHWASQEYVLETHDQFPRKCCFRIFGEDRINNMNIQAGEELRVSFDIDAREYNGRYFNKPYFFPAQKLLDLYDVNNSIGGIVCRMICG